MSVLHRRRTVENIFFVAVYSVLCFTIYRIGYPFVLPFNYFQYLDKLSLEQFLWPSLLSLHAQPPLPNLMLGIGLRLQLITSIPVENWLFATQYLMGIVIVLCLGYLCRQILSRSSFTYLFMGLFLLNPMYYFFLFLYFYTIHELFYLSLLFVFAYRFFSNQKASDYVGGAIALTGLVYSRSLFHYVWAIFILAFLIFMLRRINKSHRLRPFIITFCLTLLLLLSWPAKNYTLFGFFGYSSWQGYNFSQQVVADRHLIRQLFNRKESDAERPPATNIALLPTLTDPRKSDGSPNWNYYPVIEYSQQLQRQTIDALQETPALLINKVTRNYLYFIQFSGRNSYDGLIDGYIRDVSPFYCWSRFYEAAVFQYVSRDDLHPAVNGFFFIFPTIIILTIWRLVKIWNSDIVVALTISLILFTIVWVLVMSLLIDGIEGNRIRFSTEPYVMLLTVWIVSHKFRKKSPRRIDLR